MAWLPTLQSFHTNWQCQPSAVASLHCGQCLFLLERLQSRTRADVCFQRRSFGMLSRCIENDETSLAVEGEEEEGSEKEWWQKGRDYKNRQLVFDRRVVTQEEVRAVGHGLARREVLQLRKRKLGSLDMTNGWGTGAGRMRRTNVQLPAHVERISSTGNAFVKHVVKLRQSSSYRHGCGSVVVVGMVPLREISDFVVKGGKGPLIDYLFLLEHAEVPEHIKECAWRIVQVTAVVMHKLSGVDTAGGVEAVGILPLPYSFCNLQQTGTFTSALRKWCPYPRRLLVLDMIQDPGNLGTLLRTAAAFAWVWLSFFPSPASFIKSLSRDTLRTGWRPYTEALGKGDATICSARDMHLS